MLPIQALIAMPFYRLKTYFYKCLADILVWFGKQISHRRPMDFFGLFFKKQDSLSRFRPRSNPTNLILQEYGFMCKRGCLERFGLRKYESATLICHPGQPCLPTKFHGQNCGWHPRFAMQNSTSIVARISELLWQKLVDFCN